MTVYLIGAGPGDKDLITIKALKYLKKADVVIYDYLVNPEILNETKKEAELIYVGKKQGQHTLEQSQINKLIIKYAQTGKNVVRLKGGDPFLFGRGGEEAESLAKENIPFEIVPGVTSAIAVPAYAGIPVTHRKYNSTLAIITGHEDPLKETSNINWKKLASSLETIVILMGMGNLDNIVRNLIKHGRDENTPIALIYHGTFPDQKVVTGTLKNIVKKSKNITPPVVIVIGDVVKLRKKLQWFDNRILSGKTIVITRSREQSSELKEKLESLGALTVQFPTIEIKPLEDYKIVDKTLNKLNTYHWIIFTSVNGVKAFFDRLLLTSKDIRVLYGLRLVAIGPKTAEVLKIYGLKLDIIPQKFVAESLIEELSKFNMKNQKVLLVRSNLARDFLCQKLKEMGAFVTDLIIYKTEKSNVKTDNIVELLKNNKVDYLTFTSSSTVRNFVEILNGYNLKKLLKNVVITSIGPITSQTAIELLGRFDLQAINYTIDGIIDVILDHVKKNDLKPRKTATKKHQEIIPCSLGYVPEFDSLKN